jgi:hypothetical protein
MPEAPPHLILNNFKSKVLIFHSLNVYISIVEFDFSMYILWSFEDLMDN